MIIHIVMFQFKDENKQNNISLVKARLEALVTKIDPLVFIEVGIDFNQSERAFDLSLYSKFNTLEDLKTYAVHEEHLKVLKLIREVTVESRVVDYEI